MDLQLSGKRAIVSGSTAGIGLAIATALAREGARVTVTGRTGGRVDAALERITADVPDAAVDGIAADLATAAGARTLFAARPEADILVNNLGIYKMRPFQEISDEEWSEMLSVNVISGARLSRLYLPGMLARGWGRVIFVSSESGLNIPPDMIHYGVSKTAILALSRGLALTTAGSAVTVNAILPGPTLTEGVRGFLEETVRKHGGDIESAGREFVARARPSSLIGRLADPAEVAALAAYVASPLASATNGAALRVDGGVVNMPF
jgi:NAD(P)-dependent dehydrogenase (short-subunit alcohol dehydrogenase family)